MSHRKEAEITKAVPESSPVSSEEPKTSQEGLKSIDDGMEEDTRKEVVEEPVKKVQLSQLSSLFWAPPKCPPGYAPDKYGKCRKIVWNVTPTCEKSKPIKDLQSIIIKKVTPLQQ